MLNDVTRNIQDKMVKQWLSTLIFLHIPASYITQLNDILAIAEFLVQMLKQHKM